MSLKKADVGHTLGQGRMMCCWVLNSVMGNIGLRNLKLPQKYDFYQLSSQFKFQIDF